MSAVLRIAGLSEDSVVDGPGLRLAVFTQGCPHGCPGCHNPETHDPNGGSDMTVEAIIRRLTDNPLQTGITITGGEPLIQPAAVAELAAQAKSLSYHVMLYTGFTWEELLAGGGIYAEPLSHIDVLVDGRFVKSLPSYGRGFRGSENQRAIDVRASLAAGCVVLAHL